MRVYFNTSALNRPFDDLRQARVRAEADAVATLVAEVEASRLKLVSSEYLIFELSRGPDPERIEKITSFLRLAKHSVAMSEKVADRARELERHGLRGLDALHVASAEHAEARLLVTADDRMIRAARRAKVAVSVVTPIEALTMLAWEGDHEE